MKEIDVTVTTKVSQNRQLASQIGANLGTAFHKIECRNVWKGGDEGFEKDKKAIASGESKDFIRRIKTLKITNFSNNHSTHTIADSRNT